MTVVVDASVVVAALIDRGERGTWAIGVIRSEALLAPQLMPAEVANTLRRASLRGVVPDDVSTTAHDHLRALPVDLLGYGRVAVRAWELRRSVSIYDAWYIAIAETMNVALATLDARLARAVGPRCDFILPPS